MSIELHRITQAMNDLSEARARARSVVQEAYPLGAEIWWERGRSLQHGVVANHCSFGEPALRVKNAATGKTYWIDVRAIR